MPRNRETLSASKIKSTLLKDNRFVERFPFLRNAKAKADSLGGCAPCQRGKKGKALDAAIEEVTKQIAHLNDADKEALKSMLGADQVRVYYKTNQAGRTIRKMVEF